MAINLYKPWWIPTSDPFSLDEQEPAIPEGMQSLTELGIEIEKYMPDLWDKASEYDVTRFEKVRNPNTGEIETQFPFKWNDEQKELFQVPAERAAYLLDQYEPLSGLREKSALHNLNISFPEKWGYSVDEAFETGVSTGLPATIASVGKLAEKSIEYFFGNVDEGFEREFGSDDEMVDTDQGKVPKAWMEEAGDEKPLVFGKSQYSDFYTEEQRELYKKQYSEKIADLNKEKEKDVPDEKTLSVLDKINTWAEKTAIKNIKKLDERHKKDLRYQAWQEYSSNKPAGWWATVSTPEYVVDLALGMVPSMGLLGAAAATAQVSIPAALAAGSLGHLPLEATGHYTEAYKWTLENTEDEELAKDNAAFATAEYLSIVAATEGFGVLRLLKRMVPRQVRNSASAGTFRKLYRNNIATPERISQLKALKKTVPGKTVDYMYRGLRDPFSEAFQEYIQYSGSILSEAGYKGESQDLMGILSGNHPLVDEKELQQSVIGGGLFGAGYSGGAYINKTMKWNKWTNKANSILNTEYGVDTGVPDVDLITSGEYNLPVILDEGEPTLENYFKELLYPGSEERVIVSREKAAGSRLGNVIKNQKDYTNSAVAEKLAESIVALGKSEWDKVSSNTKSSVNSHLRGAIQNIQGNSSGGEDIINSKILENNDNIAKDILNGKIIFQSTRLGTRISETSRRKLKIKDKGYADSIIKMYESEIAENFEGKEVTPSNIRSYLSREYGIDLDKGLKKEITSSIQKHIEKEVSTSLQKEAEKQAERQIEQQMESEALKVIQKKVGIKEYKSGKKDEGVSPSVIGQVAVVLEGDNKGKSGKITVHDAKKGLVAIRLEDGTRIGPIKESDVALTEIPTAPAKSDAPSPSLNISEADELYELGQLDEGQKELVDSYEDPEKRARAIKAFFTSTSTPEGNQIINKYDARKMLDKPDATLEEKIVGTMALEKGTPANDAQVSDVRKILAMEKVSSRKKHPDIFEAYDKFKVDEKQEADENLAVSVNKLLDVVRKNKKAHTKKKKPTVKQELKQKVNKVLDIKSEYDILAKSIELQKAAGEISPEDSKKLASLRSKLGVSYVFIEIKEELSKLGVLKAIERIIITDETPQQKKFHKIGDTYERGQKKATKAFIAKALDEIMGGHAPDIQKTLKNEIKEDPNAVGAYSEGMVEFILGRSTQHTAYHEPIHWFMNRILNDGDYESVIDHFGDEEAATSAAADWYMGQKDRTLTEKIRDIFRRFWISVQKFFNRQVNSEDTIFDIFSRIGRDFTIRNFKDRMDEYDIGVDVEFDGVDQLMILPAMSETSFDEMLERLYKIPVSEYNPRQRTLMNETFILHNPSKSGKYISLSTSQIPASDHSRISLPYEYSFSNNLAQNKSETISLGSPFSTKGLSKYEAAVVKSFYKNAIDAEWTEGKKSVDKQTLIAEYESYIEKEFPLNAYSIRLLSENINKHGVVAPTLFDNLLPNATTKYIANDFFSSRIMMTDQDFYTGFGHNFQLDPSSSMKKLDSDKKALSEIGDHSPTFNGLGWYVYVEPRIKNIKQLEGLALVYEFQQDINDVIDKMDNTGDEDIKYGLLSKFSQQITSGQSTPEEAARNQLIYKATLFAHERMKIEASHRGDDEIVRYHVNLDENTGFKLTQVAKSLRHYRDIRNNIKDRISELDRDINKGIRRGIINRLMQKVEYNETVNWNKLLKSASKKPEKEKYAHIEKYIEKRFTSIILALMPPQTDAPSLTVFEHRGSYTSVRYRINKNTGNVEGVKSISSILNTIGVSEEGKKSILKTLKSQAKFDNVLQTVESPFNDLSSQPRIEKILDLEGIDLMLRDAMYDFFTQLGSIFRTSLQLGKGKDLLPALDGYAFEAEINKAFGKIISFRKKNKIKTEVGNIKRNQFKKRLQYKITNALIPDDVVLGKRIKKIAKRYVDTYNRQVKGLVNKLENKVDTYAENLENLKSLSPEDLDKTQKLRHEQNRFKEISIHHSILMAHERGNRVWALAGAEAHLKLEGSSQIDTAKLYLNEFELYDSKRVKTYEEWKIKSLAQTQPAHMSFVDAYFGLGRGNHLKSDEQITEELEKFKNSLFGPEGQSAVFVTSHDIRVTLMDNKWYSYKGISEKNKIEITYEEVKKYYIDAPKLGPVWTAARKVLKRLGLKAEYKNYSALKAPVAIVRLPDNEIEMAPVKRFHRIEEESEFEKKESKSQELARKTGTKDQSTIIKDTITEDAVNLSRAVQKFNMPEKIKDLFSVSFNKAKDKYGIEVADYVPIMGKALKAIPDRESRDMVKNLLSEWAVSVDPDVGIKMRSDNKSIKLIELMGFAGRKQKRIKRQIADLDVVGNIESALDDQGSEDSHDLIREGLQISDTTDMEEIENNNEIEVYNFSDNRFFKFLEATKSKGYLSIEDTAELMSQVSLLDFGDFSSFLSKEHGWEPITTADNNTLRNFWLSNQPINRQSAYDKPGWWYANMTYGGTVISNKDDKRLVPKVGGHPKYGKDIRNNKDLSRTANVSFLDWDNKSYNWSTGADLKYSRLYLKDMVDVHKGEEKGGFYSTQSYVTLNGALIRNLDTKFSQYANDTIGDGLVRTIVAVKASGNQPSFIIARASKDIMDIASEVDSIIEYLDYEVGVGNMTESNKKEFLISMSHETKKSPLNKHVEAQHILQHEVMKRARGRDYLIRTPSASHHSRRLGIDDGNGVVALGTGDYTIKIIDQSKTFVSRGMPNATGSSKKIPMVDYIAGLPDKYHGDGALWVESEYLDRTAYYVGRVPTAPSSSKLREIKTRIRYISKNDEFGNKHYRQQEKEQGLGGSEIIEGTHYLALKHNEFVVEEDIYITDESDNIVAYTANVDGNIQIYDGEDNRITMFGTLDEAKEPDGGSGVFKLNGRISTDILTLPEESRRIVKVPKQQGHNSAAFPWMWMSHLYDSSFDGLRDALLTRMLNVARGNMNALFSARSEPQVMRALMGQFKSDGLTIMDEVDRLIEPTPGQMIQDGFMFPHIITGIIDPVKNKIIKENSYGGRRRGFGTFPAIKADLTRTIVKNKDGVVVSADDVTMLRFLKDFLNVEGFGNELVNNINEALRSRKEYLMAGRWPVYTIGSMFLARIEKIMPKGHGAVVWFHPESATGKLQADYDGDTGFLLAPYFGQNYTDRTIVNKFNDKNTKSSLENLESFVRLEYFKKPSVEYKMTSKKDMYIVTGKLGRGMNAQGMLMNAVTFLEDMYYKDLKMDIGGQKIVVRNPNEESIIMSYAPLNDDVTQEMLDNAKMGTLVNKDGSEWESGDKYLRTTPLKQLHTLLQAAVDNSKEYLLADWSFGGWKWIAPRIFIQDNGSPIGSNQAGSIASLVRKELMHNVSKRGVDMSDNKRQDIDGMFKTSKEMYELNSMSGVQRGQKIKEKANIRRIRYGKDSRLAKRTSEVEKIVFNNKLLPLERLIAIPHESLLQYEESNPDDKVHGNPFGYHPNRIQRAIMHTQQDMYTLQKETQRWYPETKAFEKDKEIGRRLVNEMTREFYNIAMQQRLYKDSTKSRITSAGYPYQEKIIEFIEKWLTKGDSKKGLPSWNDLSDEQQAYATLRFLRGALTFSTKTHKKVGEKEKRLHNQIIDLKAKAVEEIDLGIVEEIENKIEKIEKQLSNIYTPSTYQSVSRPRDIEKMLPMPLMHPSVWTAYANLFGPNLRRASSEKISLKSDARYEDRKRRITEEILKECG